MSDTTNTPRLSRRTFPDGAWEFDPDLQKSFSVSWVEGETEGRKWAMEKARLYERDIRAGKYQLLEAPCIETLNGIVSYTARFIPIEGSTWIPCSCNSAFVCALHALLPQSKP